MQYGCSRHVYYMSLVLCFYFRISMFQTILDMFLFQTIDALDNIRYISISEYRCSRQYQICFYFRISMFQTILDMFLFQIIDVSRQYQIYFYFRLSMFQTILDMFLFQTIDALDNIRYVSISDYRCSRQYQICFYFRLSMLQTILDMKSMWQRKKN